MHIHGNLVVWWFGCWLGLGVVVGLVWWWLWAGCRWLWWSWGVWLRFGYDHGPTVDNGVQEEESWSIATY